MENSLKQKKVRVLRDSDVHPNGIPKLKSNKPIIVAILSSHCPWCFKQVDELGKVARDSRFEVAAVITDQGNVGNYMLKATNSSGVPTIVVFKGGRYEKHNSGFQDSNSLMNFASR